MNVNIEASWKDVLKDEFEQPYFKKLSAFVKHEYSTSTCFPKRNEIFSAFNHCSFDDVKVVIIGQDPYHGVNQANGLCFSVHDGIRHPPSLINIFKELSTDINKPYQKSGDLTMWAEQGVLLLNATLTVRSGEAGSHQKQGWEKFTDAVIEQVSKNKEHIVFLLWGGFAKKKGKNIDQNKHKVFTSGHPSPLSANRGYWFGNKHYSQVNKYLKTHDIQEILW